MKLAGKFQPVQLYNRPYRPHPFMDAIYPLGQDFSNNINLLQPTGSFGTKNAIGKDAGDPRRSYVKLKLVKDSLLRAVVRRCYDTRPEINRE